MDAIFGYGSLSEQLINKFAFFDHDFIIIDNDEEAMKNLSALGFTTFSVGLETVGPDDIDGMDLDNILFLDLDEEIKYKVIENAGKKWPEAFLLTLDAVSFQKEKLGLGKDNSLTSSEIISNELIRQKISFVI